MKIVCFILALFSLSACVTTTGGEGIPSNQIRIGTQYSESDFRQLTKWHSVVSRETKNPFAFKNHTKTLSKIDPLKALSAANSYINSVKYVSDEKNYNSEDYWATPTEFFKNGGDCEDYAIAKYFLLIQSGFDPRTMYISVGRNIKRNEIHAVLIVKVNNEFYILDNDVEYVYNSKTNRHFQPIYFVNKFGMWST